MSANGKDIQNSMLISDVLYLDQPSLVCIFLSVMFEGLVAGTMNINIYWDCTLCRLVEMYLLLTYSAYFVTLKLEIHGTFLQNICKLLPDYMLSYHKRQYSL
jgi:hypothetical protein